MRDLALRLEDRPGALAEMGEALGRSGVSIEGGGAFTVDGKGIAHFLVADALLARKALTKAGIEVVADREVLVQRLDQSRPGQLGAISRRMAEARALGRRVFSEAQGLVSRGRKVPASMIPSRTRYRVTPDLIRSGPASLGPTTAAACSKRVATPSAS